MIPACAGSSPVTHPIFQPLGNDTLSSPKQFKFPDLDPFVPHFLLRNQHLQTLVARFFDYPRSVEDVEHISVSFADGDQVSFYVDRCVSSLVQDDLQHIVALFHGLGGSADSSYNLRISHKLRSQGFDVARFNHRGCDSKYPAAQIYHSGSAKDVGHALLALSRAHPKAKIIAVGFSLSAIMLLNLLAREAALIAELQPVLSAAIVVCPPLDLDASSLKMVRGWNRIYDKYFARLLTKQVCDRQLIGPDFNHSAARKSLRFFDEEFTARKAGFVSRDDYYRQCSPLGHLAQIRIPTTIIASKDDPVVHTSSYDSVMEHPFLKVLLTSHGGHLGFLANRKTQFGDRRWLDDAIVRICSANLVKKVADEDHTGE